MIPVVMLDSKVWIVVHSRHTDRPVHDRQAEEEEVDLEDLHDQDHVVDQSHVVDRNHVVDQDQELKENLHQICIYAKNDRWWPMNGKHVSEEKTKTDLIQKFITSEKIMSEKENSLLDLRNVVENINPFTSNQLHCTLMFFVRGGYFSSRKVYERVHWLILRYLINTICRQ